MGLINLFIYIISFILLWFGAGLIISSANKFSKRLRLSPFIFSFAFLGILTSIPEFSVGMQAIADHDAEIFVGNLLGGIIVIFLVVIPVLAIFGNGISLKHEFDNKSLLLAMGLISLPSILTLDKKVTNPEGIVMITSYLAFAYLIQKKNGILRGKNDDLLEIATYSFKDFAKLVLGFGIVFVSSSLIVDKTVYFADLFKISTFYIGLIIIALGTDLPELTLAIRSVVAGKKELAMGDYLGAAAFSTFLFGLFTILHSGEIITISNFLVTFIFIVLALFLFYFFTITKQYISRKNGIILLVCYLIFVAIEFT